LLNIHRSNFQAHPFHLVSPSPWPLYTSISLLTITTSGVLSFHGFNNSEYFLTLAFFTLVLSMSFWFRDIISEGKHKNMFQTILANNKLNIVKAINSEQIKHIKYHSNINKLNLNKDQLGYYLAGLLEGDGHISLPFLGNTILNRVLNPRIVFTSHINNLELYVYIQSVLGGIGRFQKVNNNIIRYIIGDVKGITLFINTVHNKLRTPKIESFNQLIEFFNKKYNFIIPKSNLDISDLFSNSWFAGFTEADGHFGVKIVDSKPKSCTRKRSVSDNISLRFILDQRFIDKKTSLSMLNIMEKISQTLLCNLTVYESKNNKILSIKVVAIDKIKLIISYFNKYPLLGIKSEDFKDWETVYHMIISKEHLTEKGRSKIKFIQSNMNSKRIDIN
jgi:LAGLIDADG endonuclease/Cytochrome c oxidase subunit III